MKLKRLRLHHFRNYDSCTLLFEEGIHVFYGHNAQGKTNLLESMMYLSTTRSHRNVKDQDLIQYGQEAFFLQGDVQKQHACEMLRISVTDEGKNLFLFERSIPSVSEFIGAFNAVMFCPDDMGLFHASPRVRRRFIDIEIGKLSKSYMQTLNQSLKLLKERNALLKRNRIDETYLQVVTKALAQAQAVIIRQRYHFAQSLVASGSGFYTQLSEDQTVFGIEYLSCVPYSDDLKQMQEALMQKYEKSKERDLLMKATTVGIHKEDYRFTINGYPLEQHASQGQKRTLLLALKLAMVSLIHDISKEYPVLLLDDVFSELDEKRRAKLFAILPQEVQVFISATEVETKHFMNLHRKVTLWEVQNGKITRKECVYG